MSYSSQTPAEDFADGIMYYENSHSYDSIVHEFDTGVNEQCLVALKISAIDHGYNHASNEYDNSTGAFYFRTKGSACQWKAVTPCYGSDCGDCVILLMTDADGKLEWYSDYSNPYWANPTCNPSYEIYKWIQVQLTVEETWISQA